MKKANHNEMDLVLRSLAKSGRDDSSLGSGPSSGDNNGDIGQHLDADELNSFAEGLVPEPARLRYTEHLADCVSCRRIVVSLTQASGSVGQTAVAHRESGPGFWQRMAALFSPSVLRFAVPALALTAVVAISLLALRQESRPEFVAQHQREVAATSATAPEAAEQPLSSSGKETSLVPQSPAGSTASTDAAREERKNPPGDQGEMAKLPANTDLAAAAPKLKDSPPPPPPAPASEGTRSQPSFAPEPKVGALAPGRPVISEVDKKAEVRREEQPPEPKAQQRVRDEQKVEARKEAEDDRSAFKTNAPSGPRRSDGLMSERPRYGVKNQKRSSDEDEETRSVSGRRFRRQGNSWIDTGYESSRVTINIVRGTEQFRALVADEPGIRSIADQLAGEVIVVWKGRAYRIR